MFNLFRARDSDLLWKLGEVHDTLQRIEALLRSQGKDTARTAEIMDLMSKDCGDCECDQFDDLDDLLDTDTREY